MFQARLQIIHRMPTGAKGGAPNALAPKTGSPIPKLVGLLILGLTLPIGGTAADPVYQQSPARDESGAAAALQPWKGFHARYAVYHNGKLTGKSDVVMTIEERTWTLKSESSGTHGLAKVLGARENGMVDGHIEGGRFLPDEFAHQTRFIGVDRRWSASFDWSTQKVELRKGRQAETFDLGPEVMDPLTLTVEMRRQLQNNIRRLKFVVADEDQLKEQKFRARAPQRLDTSLGCLRTIPVERIHHSQTRFTRAWHAPQLNYLTVRMEHGKQDGDHLEMRISELWIDGEPVLASAGCASE